MIRKRKNVFILAFLMSVLILLSGCVSSKEALKVQLFREADNELELEVLEYIELYDFSDFMTMIHNYFMILMIIIIIQDSLVIFHSF